MNCMMSDSMLFSTASLLDASATRFDVVAKAALWLLALAVVLITLAPRRKQSGEGDLHLHHRWSFVERFAYGGFIATVALLGLTSLTSVLCFGAMHGWWLVAHMFAAGAYLAFVVVMALLVSHRFPIVQPALPSSDPSPTSSTSAQRTGTALSEPRLLLTTKVYWLMLALSVLVVGTILLTMLPFLGTRNSMQMIALHRYCGLGLFVTALIHPLLLMKCSR